MCTYRRHLKDNEKVNMGRNVSTVIAKPGAEIPKKCKDPCTFTISCIICNNTFDNGMLDLGAPINVMSLSFFHFLVSWPFKNYKCWNSVGQ